MRTRIVRSRRSVAVLTLAARLAALSPPQVARDDEAMAVRRVERPTATASAGAVRDATAPGREAPPEQQLRPVDSQHAAPLATGALAALGMQVESIPVNGN